MALQDWHVVYVTRPTANGTTYHLAMRDWQIKLARWALIANVVAWGIAGVVAAAGAVV